MSDALAELAARGGVAGCSADDLAALESAHGRTLPATYRAFLATAGRAAGSFLEGTDFLFPAVLDLRRLAEALLSESEAREQLGPDDLVFAAHQGYQFLFLRGDADDPPVFHYLEGDPDARRVADRFTEWLAGCIADERDAR